GKLIQPRCLVAGRRTDFSFVKFATEAAEGGALINAWRIKGNVAVDRIFHWTAEHFAIGNIAVATADDGWNPLMLKRRSVSGPLIWTRSVLSIKCFSAFIPGCSLR